MVQAEPEAEADPQYVPLVSSYPFANSPLVYSNYYPAGYFPSVSGSISPFFNGLATRQLAHPGTAQEDQPDTRIDAYARCKDIFRVLLVIIWILDPDFTFPFI